jgi:hypothetical protein
MNLEYRDLMITSVSHQGFGKHYRLVTACEDGSAIQVCGISTPEDCVLTFANQWDRDIAG